MTVLNIFVVLIFLNEMHGFKYLTKENKKKDSYNLKKNREATKDEDKK